MTTTPTASSTLTAHFAHANGFPAGSYRTFFDYLGDELSIFALEKFAHNPTFPLVDNWPHQVDELIDYIERNTADKIIAIGHSFGGLVSYMACCKRPDLFKGLIMLDPPVAAGLSRHVFRLAKSTRLINKLTPASRTQVRKQSWHKDEDIHQYFASRALFRNMDKRCIDDYIQSATHISGGNRQLVYERDIEANIFRTIPHNLHEFYGQLNCPARLITARYTDVCVPRLRQPFLKRNPTMTHLELPKGGHMFVLEHPKLVATAVLSTIKQWGLI